MLRSDLMNPDSDISNKFIIKLYKIIYKYIYLNGTTCYIEK